MDVSHSERFRPGARVVPKGHKRASRREVAGSGDGVDSEGRRLDDVLASVVDKDLVGGLVLGTAAWLASVSVKDSPFPRTAGCRYVERSAIVKDLGLPKRVVAAAIPRLVKAGALRIVDDRPGRSMWLEVVSTAVVARWKSGVRLRLPAALRCGVRAAVLGVVGYVVGQQRGGWCRDSRGRMAEALGLSLPATKRALADAEGRFLRSRGRIPTARRCWELVDEADDHAGDPCASEPTPAPNRADTRAPASHASPEETGGTPEGFRKTAPNPAAPGETDLPRTGAPGRGSEPSAVVGEWVCAAIRSGIEGLDPSNSKHTSCVKVLLHRLDPTAPQWRVGSWETFARRLCQWAGHVEDLSRWLVRVVQRRGPDNLLAYLRESSKRGDPGQLLHSELKNELGRGAEVVEVFPPAVEKALEGPYKDRVAQLIRGVAKRLAEPDKAKRARSRLELAALLGRGNLVAAGRVLRQALGGEGPTDETLSEFLGSVCTVSRAREVLAA